MKPANLFDPPGHSDDASSFRAGLDEIRSSSDVDVGDYFDGSDVLPKRAKGRIVDIVGDSGRSASDAVDARDALRNIDGVSDREISTFVEDGSTGSVKFLSEVDQGTVDNVFSFDVDGGASDLAVRARAGIAQAYSREFLSTGSWANDIYPDAADAEDVANKIADDINVLNGKGNVEGLARTLSRGDDGGSGAYLERLPDPDASDSDGYDPSSPVKGVALELRTARQAADELDSDESLRMSAAPDVDFDEDLSETQIEDVAEKVYGERESAVVSSDLTTNPEFDAVQEITDSDGNTRRIYLESKNTENAPPRSKVRGQAARFFASQIADGADMENLRVTFVTRSDSQAASLNDILDAEWFTARASSTGSG
ncbi:hypothetical protein GJ629_13050 [Halapricum sp. CBA1109]|uniref:hypothetical protein n=1 Tax=Halapricum sp. CBA1109 TaxID=2668068 RepID=UPI0012FAA83D|nr:hypothetical protein [Halapricum sp. CBA1109]MUV90713.1 hypothetical protein [Halapricum sp. CBA1109]